MAGPPVVSPWTARKWLTSANSLGAATENRTRFYSMARCRVSVNTLAAWSGFSAACPRHGDVKRAGCQGPSPNTCPLPPQTSEAQHGIEPWTSPYQGGALPLSNRAREPVRGIEPPPLPYKGSVLPLALYRRGCCLPGTRTPPTTFRALRPTARREGSIESARTTRTFSSIFSMECFPLLHHGGLRCLSGNRTPLTASNSRAAHLARQRQ